MQIDSVSAKEARRICGFETISMMDYLQRSGVFVPSDRRRARKGKGRRYTFRDLIVLKAIATLLRNGASVAALKKALVEFQRAKWKADEASLENEVGGVLRYLLIGPGGIFFAKSQETLYDLTREGQLSFSFLLDIANIHDEVRFGLRQIELPLSVA